MNEPLLIEVQNVFKSSWFYSTVPVFCFRISFLITLHHICGHVSLNFSRLQQFLRLSCSSSTCKILLFCSNLSRFSFCDSKCIMMGFPTLSYKSLGLYFCFSVFLFLGYSDEMGFINVSLRPFITESPAYWST